MTPGSTPSFSIAATAQNGEDEQLNMEINAEIEMKRLLKVRCLS